MPADSLREPIRLILINDWDPGDCARSEAAHHTYDGYIEPLADLLERDADEEAIITFLKEREAEIMCFPAAGTGHLKRIARKLLSLRRRET